MASRQDDWQGGDRSIARRLAEGCAGRQNRDLVGGRPSNYRSTLSLMIEVG